MTLTRIVHPHDAAPRWALCGDWQYHFLTDAPWNGGVETGETLAFEYGSPVSPIVPSKNGLVSGLVSGVPTNPTFLAT